MKENNGFLAVLAVCALTLVITGCSEKAKTLQLGASQFSAQSISAIDLAQANAHREVTQIALTDQQKNSQFVSQALSGSGDVAPSQFETWVNIYKPQVSPGEPVRQAKYDKLKQQYIQFSKVFGSLDKGSVLAADSVEQAAPLIKKLAASMAALAHNQQKYPVEFMRERVGLLTQINAVRDDKTLAKSEKQFRMKVLAKSVDDLAQAELQANRQVVEAATKAAIMGMKLKELTEDYGMVTLDDIVEGIGISFDIASQLTGRDFTKLQGKVDDIVTTINGDDEMKLLFTQALQSLQSK
ncbi:hypothetical protein V5T82_03950 [Magnetovibrio sp. PR-2]|uniref:hypothetical protein n=1 Tax=Magnetovibrio sp. PR-2 TaxID=3120356 RepID=UPI002FCE0CD5